MKTKNMQYFGVFMAVLLFFGISLKASDADRQVESALRDSYVFKTYLKDDKITPEAKDGSVTLSGTVEDESHIALAGDTAAGIPGVKKVDNRLAFDGERPAPGSDALISSRVKAALMFHRNVSAAKTEVNVKDGVVTLGGDADNEAQKELTASYAADVDGVRSVKNAMKVPSGRAGAACGPCERVDDASITAQVKMALLAHRSTSTVKAGVRTDNGVVTLTGQAGDEAEKALAGKLAGDVKGVSRVNNLMTSGR